MTEQLQSYTRTISKWVESIRIPNIKNEPNHAMARAHDYNHRIEKTKAKIQSLIDAIKPYIKARNLDGGYIAVHAGDGKIMNANDILDELHYTIGSYKIPRVDDSIGSDVWKRMDDGIGDAVWYDYLGGQEIRESGGYIVVMLSNDGIDLLNRIAKEVLSSPTTT